MQETWTVDLVTQASDAETSPTQRVAQLFDDQPDVPRLALGMPVIQLIGAEHDEADVWAVAAQGKLELS